MRALALAAALFPLLGYLFEPAIQLANAYTDQTAIGFQLGFTGAPEADTAFLPFEVSPAPDQPRGQVTQLRQLHLQLAFIGLGALCEDIEDQGGPVQHAATAGFFDVSFLDGAERLAYEDQAGAGFFKQFGQLFDFAAAYKIARIGPVTRRRDYANNFSACRTREFLEFVQRFGAG